MKKLAVLADEISLVHFESYLLEAGDKLEEWNVWFYKFVAVEDLAVLVGAGANFLTQKEVGQIKHVEALAIFPCFAWTIPLVWSRIKHLTATEVIHGLDGLRNVGAIGPRFDSMRATLVSFLVPSSDDNSTTALRKGWKNHLELTVSEESYRKAWVGCAIRLGLDWEMESELLGPTDFLVLYRDSWSQLGVSLESQVRCILALAEATRKIERLIVKTKCKEEESLERGLVDKFAGQIQSPQLTAIGWSSLIQTDLESCLIGNPELLLFAGVLGNPGAVFAYEGTFTVTMSRFGASGTKLFYPHETDIGAEAHSDQSSFVIQQSNWVEWFASADMKMASSAQPSRSGYLDNFHKGRKEPSIWMTMAKVLPRPMFTLAIMIRSLLAARRAT